MARSQPVFIPLRDLITPPTGIIKHIKDSYWVCCPEEGLLFVRLNQSKELIEQCNANESIAVRVRDMMYPTLDVKFVPSVFLRVNLRNYV